MRPRQLALELSVDAWQAHKCSKEDRNICLGGICWRAAQAIAQHPLPKVDIIQGSHVCRCQCQYIPSFTTSTCTCTATQ